MSTIITNTLDKTYTLLTKGAPEIMKNLFKKEYVPHDYDYKLQQLSEEGLRVLAMGYKEIDELNCSN